jgi:hypothetical protein
VATLDPRHHTFFPDRSIKCSDTSRTPRSKANPSHAGPLTPPGNHIPMLFDQPALCGHPRCCAGVVREGRCHSMTLCRPLPYLLHITPSKEDGGTLERGTTTYSAPAWTAPCRDGNGHITRGQRVYRPAPARQTLCPRPPPVTGKMLCPCPSPAGTPNPRAHPYGWGGASHRRTEEVREARRAAHPAGGGREGGRRRAAHLAGGRR